MSPSDTSPVKSQTLPQKHKGNKIIKIHENMNNNDKVVLLLLMDCFKYLPLFVGVLCWYVLVCITSFPF